MADDDHVRAIRRDSLQNLIGGMADEHVRLECHMALLCLASQALEQFFVMTGGQFNDRLGPDC
jgi:hypothetical protein